MAFRLLLPIIFFSFFSGLQASGQASDEWVVLDSRRKVVSQILADSVFEFSPNALLVFRNNKPFMVTPQGKEITESMDSISIHKGKGEPFALISEGGKTRLINGRLQTLANNVKNARGLNHAILVQTTTQEFIWLGLEKQLKGPSVFDSAEVFSDQVAVGKVNGKLYWLNPQQGPVLLQTPKTAGIGSIRKGIECTNGQVSTLTLLQGGYLVHFNIKGALLNSPAKAVDVRAALSGVIFRNGPDWYYQEPTKALPIPLKGKVISNDYQKIIVNRQNKFFAFWKGGKATWLKLETADSVGLFHSGLASFRYKGKFGFIDSIGYIRIAARYQKATDFHHNFSLVKAGGKWGVIDRRENFVLPPSNDTVWYSHGQFVQQSGNRVSLFDPVSGDRSEAYDSICFSPNGFITNRSGKQGYLSTKGKTVLVPRFEAVQFITTLNTIAFRQNHIWFFPEGSIGRIQSARKLAGCSTGVYCFIQPGSIK